MTHALPGDAGDFPGRITLELTNRCNLNCTFCPRRYMEKERGFMDTALAMRLLDEMAEHSPVAVVPFFRGESLLHPEWFDILCHSQKASVGEIQFTTNASLLTPENAEKILDLELSFISFSLDTVDETLYNASRRGANYGQTLKNVLNFLERRDARGVKTRVQVSAVETPEHQPGMDAFVEFWRDRADRVRVYVEHSADGQPGSIDQPMQEFDNRLPCHKVFTDMVVYWNGQVACCNHDWTRQVNGTPLGDVSKDGMAKVWQGDAYRALRQAHASGVLDGVAPCNGCDHWKMYYTKAGFLGRTYCKN
jgi:MoaA/NifB/PqqE/SkfB family radical SAM enzyme